MNPQDPIDLIRQRFERESGGRRLRTTLYLAIRHLILDAALPPGTSLPPTRVLAKALGFGRSTLVRVYEQLVREGYLESRGGADTRVSAALPPAQPVPAGAAPRASVAAALSQRGRAIAHHATSSRIQGGAFVPGVPDVGLFPFPTWRRLLSKNVRFEQRHLARYSQGGYGPLKVALADYLRASRMMACTPQQVLILNGSHQAIDLCARMLCDPGDRVWMEDPGYWGARNVLRANGLTLEPIPVDDEGIAPPAVVPGAAPRLTFVSPSSQYPTGVVMSLNRRLRLLEQAEANDGWIIEDDYDNEIRYHPHAIGALFGQSRAQRVLYLGTFSKTMFPGLRLAYLVVPELLAEAFAIGNAELYREGRMIEQAALAEFIDSGHLSAHLKRVRNIYQERRNVLRTAIESRLAGAVRTTGGMAGLHLPYHFTTALDDVALAKEALEAGIVFRPLSMYYDDPGHRRSGMVLGFAAVPSEEIDAAAGRLCAIVDRHLTRR
ncbi:MocR-like pyridoxine biosynthesis transcription factor PdxR [Denitromonas iodatirespirans]|uniref:PLP-dependent aminotransferase family protein n=1 Tax=Denitromonas iodatirespirans TaxID=2795389 RepID=A0A944DT99_DENI1|nr:PLP-dependent aminotransferase family protein [Denitromonas iodatirespirans]MBT0964054.1 PLP-dependent aminotransferase family protein [Denitromonas iodatirespirans]